MQKKNDGFSIIELIIVIGSLSAITALALFTFNNQSVGTLESEASIIASRLSLAQSYAITSVNGKQWGMHFNNVTSTAPWYALFQGSSYTAASTTYYLPSIVGFQAPTSTASTSVVFNKFTGKTNATTTIIIYLQNNTSTTKSIIISPEGKITTQ